MQNTATRSDTADGASGPGDQSGQGGPGGPATGQPAAPAGDPRLRWSSADGRPAAPVLRFRRDGILPTIAAALSVRGETLTGTAGKADQPPSLHHLVQDFLDTLTSGQRERFTGRCPEAILVSRHLTAVENARSRRASRKPLTANEARRSLKQSKITARRIREDGDPLHGSYAPPCRSCEALLAHFGVRAVDLTPASEKA
ncbi:MULTISPECIES: YwqJ-related putative deaminase [unclassified Streptomyces]|uniref:YwqJ-related putative deaminase n=1 Tax=unclassified Streptomyces TaxID=2593676 RepID=UPI002E102D8C|nr:MULTISPECIES: YwqJ-related putative deaminase [unclassified Streptomyces]WSR26381.1 YwqJ-related putative deaminase [Streptomyces sp. NBC_01205]